VGFYSNATGGVHGFLLSKGAFTNIDVPGASSTEAQGISLEGDIVGHFNAKGQHGFLLSKGVFTTIDVPGASSTAAQGINPKGDIVGEFNAKGVIHGFLLSK
jgi:uncharacterized membrane protein